MDAFSQNRLDELKMKDSSLLSPDDIGFLRARASYLTEEEMNRLFQTEVKKPEDMTLAELKELAKSMSLEISANASKATYLEKITEALTK